MKKATVIIPAYNEEGAIGGLLAEIKNQDLMDHYEFIVINDCSTDRTAQLVAQYPVRCISHLTNKGYGAALKTGIREATCDKVIMMDSDGQHAPDKLNDIARCLDTYAMVIGERDPESFQVANRKLGKKIIRVVGSYLVEQPLPDFNSGYRGFQRKYILGMLSIMPNGFSFSTTSTLAFLKHGFDIATLPISVRRRQGRKSSVKFFRDGFRTFLLLFRIIMLFNPLKIFMPASAAALVLGTGWAVAGILTYHKIPNGGVLMLLLSMLLFVVGLISDQISMLNLREESRGR